MKKLFYLGLTALLMFFAFGSANAQDKNITVSIDPMEWTMGSATVPKVTVDLGNTGLVLGSEAGKAVIKLMFWIDELSGGGVGGDFGIGGVAVNAGTVDDPLEQIIDKDGDIDLDVEKLGFTDGLWTVGAMVVKYENQDEAFDGGYTVNDPMGFATMFNVLPAAEPEPDPATVPDTVTVTLGNNKSWSLSESASNLTFKIELNTPSSVKFGSTDTSVAVLAIFTKENVVDTQLFTGYATSQVATKYLSSYSALVSKLTVGKWAIDYRLVTGKSTVSAPVAFNADKAVLAKASDTLTVSKGTLPKPTFSPRTGSELDAGDTVKISCTNESSEIYYTTGNAAFSTTAWTKYTNGVAVTEDVKIKAIAVSTDETNWDNSPIDSASYTIAVLPEDDEDAPEITFTPGNADSVDNNTEIFISGVPDGYTVSYEMYSTPREAIDAGWMQETYGEKGIYPVVTADKMILGVTLFNEEEYELYEYYRTYKVRQPSDVTMPTVYAEAGDAVELGLYPKGTKIKLDADPDGEGNENSLWYTTDGSTPAADNDKTKKVDEGYTDLTLNESITIKAIAVTADGKSSDMVTKRFKLSKDLEASLSIRQYDHAAIDSIVGKNAPIMVEFHNDYNSSLMYGEFVVYYTTDGITEPLAEMYNPVSDAIKKTESYMNDGRNETYVYFDQAGPFTLKAKAYMSLFDGDENTIVSETFTYTIDSVKEGVLEPKFSIQAREVSVGDTLRIINPNPYEAGEDEYPEVGGGPVAAAKGGLMPSQIYYSLNGVLPYYDKAAEHGVFRSSDEEIETIVIIFQEDEKGVYAYVPRNARWNESWNKLYYDTIRFEDRLHIQAICYDVERYGMSGTGAGYLVYGSDIVEAYYSIKGDISMPVITPNGGMVAKGTEVEITLAEDAAGAKIYYTTDGSRPEKDGATSKEYGAKIKVDSAMTIKAIAVKDAQVSGVAIAEFTLIPDTVKAPTFNPAAGEVEKGTKVAISCGTEKAVIYYTTDGTAPTSKSTEYKGEITIESAMTIKAIALKEGMVNSLVATAAYTIKSDDPDDPDTPVVTDTVKTPTFNPAAGEVEKGTKVAISCATDSAKIYYTTDGSMPTSSSTEYKGEISIESAMTIKAIAVKEGMVASKVAEAAYTVKEEGSANEDAELAGVNIYPNPNDGKFNVAVPVDVTVEVFNTNAQLVFRAELVAGVHSLQLTNSGMYFVRFTTENAQVIRRVIVR